MNQTSFQIVVDNTIKSTAQLLVTKGAEYAGSADRLANFKRGAKNTGVTPLQVALVYAAKHYDSICTYIRKDAAGEPQILSEPIEGRFDDLINYCILMKALVIESKQADLQRKLEDTPIQQPKTTGEQQNAQVSSAIHYAKTI